MKLLKISLALIYAVIGVFLCQQIIINSFANQKNKIDYAELNDIKYGMFSVDEWKIRLVKIVSDEFDRLYVSNQTEQELREHVAVILDKMIDDVANKIKQSNQKTTKGRIKQAFIDMFVDLKEIKKGIPQYTDAVIKELKKKKTQEQMKTLVKDQLQEFATRTTDVNDRSQLRRIYEKTSTTNIEAARQKTDDAMRTTYLRIKRLSVALVVLVVAPFVWLARTRTRPTPINFCLIVLGLVLLLTAGVATPMIDMEAKISQLTLILFGHTVQFNNQVLYFQSKSILDVFFVMISHGQLQMKFVGILLVTFSVLFPLLKLACTVAYYFNVRGTHNSKLIDFFVFKSGKWSMSDVMVIAIFMAYIGFNGVIDSQLATLSSLEAGASVLTTNGTSLQPGYYLFLTYSLLAIYFSGFLHKKTDDAPPSVQ